MSESKNNPSNKLDENPDQVTLLCVAESGARFGEMVDDHGKCWAFLATEAGRKVIAAPINNSKALQLEGVRIVGQSFEALGKLERPQLREAYLIFQSPDALLAGNLWRNTLPGSLTPALEQSISLLSQVLLQLQESTGKGKFGTSPDTWEPNGWYGSSRHQSQSKSLL